MATVARWKGEDLRLGKAAVLPMLFLGFAQFCINFNAVYLAEQHITSGVVATIFALLVIPSTLLAWAFLGQKPTRRFLWSSLVAICGIALLFVHEFRQHSARAAEIAAGIGMTLCGMLGASAANVYQARDEVRRARALLVLPPERVADILPDYPLPARVAPPRPEATDPVLQGRAALAPLPEDPLLQAFGVGARPDLAGASNVWAVDGSRSATGKSLMANDPHLWLSAPSLWYLADVRLMRSGTPMNPHASRKPFCR